MSLESNKTLGGIGAILLAIPFLNLIGIILVLISMKGMAEYYNDDDLFKNTLFGFIFGIIGALALIPVIILFVFPIAVGSTFVGAPTTFGGIGLIIVSIVVLYIFSLLGAIFYRKSLNILAEKSRDKNFETAGLILLIGAAIPLLGEILKFIAWILAATGFFSIKTPTKLPPTEPFISFSEEKKFCQFCGAENKDDAAFCWKCGKKIT
jgi:uncharacterized membrane protein